MPVLHHMPVQDEHGDWHAAYVIPGTSVMSSVLECPSEAVAKQFCQRENAKKMPPSNGQE